MSWRWYEGFAAKKLSKSLNVHDNRVEALFGYINSLLPKIVAFSLLILSLFFFYHRYILFALFCPVVAGEASFGKKVCIDIIERNIILELSFFGITFYTKKYSLHKIGKKENMSLYHRTFNDDVIYAITKEKECILLYSESTFFPFFKGNSFETYWNQIEEEVPDSILEESKDNQ